MPPDCFGARGEIEARMELEESHDEPPFTCGQLLALVDSLRDSTLRVYDVSAPTPTPHCRLGLTETTRLPEMESGLTPNSSAETATSRPGPRRVIYATLPPQLSLQSPAASGSPV